MVRTVIVGLGNIAQTRHLPAAIKNRRLDVVGIVDRNPKRLKSVGNRFGIRNRWLVKDIGSITSVDAAIVCTPPMDHYASVDACLENGWHVLCEKPFTMTVREARALIRKAESKERILSVVSNFKFSRSFRTLRDARIGEIRNIYGFQCSNLKRRLPAWYEELPFGLFYDESPHFLYLFQELAGDLEYVSSTAFVTDRNTPLQVSASLKGSVPISFFMDFDAPLSEWYLVVFGSKAVAIVDIFRDVCTVLRDDESHLAHHVIRTSLSASLQHYVGSAKTAANVAFKRQHFGNDVMFEKWAASIAAGVADESLSAHRALHSVELTHRIIDGAMRCDIERSS